MTRDKERFALLRKRAFAMIADELERDPCCKSYEGALEVMCEYPDYFDDEHATEGPCYFKITLHCYVLGPSRHYEFTGKTMGEALDKMEQTLNGWEERT